MEATKKAPSTQQVFSAASNDLLRQALNFKQPYAYQVRKDLIKRAILASADPNLMIARSGEGEPVAESPQFTPLHFACAYYDLDLQLFLLSRGANPTLFGANPHQPDQYDDGLFADDDTALASHALLAEDGIFDASDTPFNMFLIYFLSQNDPSASDKELLSAYLANNKELLKSEDVQNAICTYLDSGDGVKTKSVLHLEKVGFKLNYDFAGGTDLAATEPQSDDEAAAPASADEDATALDSAASAVAAAGDAAKFRRRQKRRTMEIPATAEEAVIDPPLVTPFAPAALPPPSFSAASAASSSAAPLLTSTTEIVDQSNGKA